MAHVRQDTLCRPTEWWKHMREQKRRMSKKERKAWVKEVEKELNPKPKTMYEWILDMNDRYGGFDKW